MLKHWSAAAVAVLAIFSSVPSATAGSDNFFLTDGEIASLPVSGAAWNNVVAQAAGTINVRCLTSYTYKDYEARMFSKALKYARTGNAADRAAVADALMATIGKETCPSGEPLGVYRNLTMVTVSADLIDFEDFRPADEAVFRNWVQSMLTKTVGGANTGPKTLQQTSEQRPNNWGNHALAARIARALYLEDTADLAIAACLLEGYSGNRSKHSDGTTKCPGAVFYYKYGYKDELGDDDRFQCDPNNRRGVNPLTCNLPHPSYLAPEGYSGALPEEMRRSHSTPDNPQEETDYNWEATSAVLPAFMMLSRNGYPEALTWENDALARVADFLFRIAGKAPGFRWPTFRDDDGDGDNDDNDNNAPWLINALLGTTYPTSAAGDTPASRNYANADWWAPAIAVGAPPPSPQCSDGLDNDGDTFIDYPADSGCTSALDNDETSAPPPPSSGFVGVQNPGTLALAASADGKRGSIFTVAQATTVVSMEFYGDGNGGGTGAQSYRLAIYNAGTGALIEDTDAGTVTSGAPAQWRSQDLQTAVTLQPGTSYLFALHTSSPASVIRYYRASEAGALRWQPTGTDSFADGISDPFGAASTDDFRLSIRAAVGEGEPVEQCQDGVNNDGDTLVDFPADPGCSSATDDSESPNPANAYAGVQVPGTLNVTANADNKRGSVFTVSATMVVDSMEAYMDGQGSGTGDQSFRYAIYNATTGAKIAESVVATVVDGSAANWRTAAFSSPVTLSPGVSYRFVLHSGASASTIRYYRSAETGALQWQAPATDAFADGAADPFGTFSTDDFRMSVRAHVQGTGIPD